MTTKEETQPRDYAPEDSPAIAWLERQFEEGNTQKLEEMVELWETFELMGRIGRTLRRVFIALGKVLVWFAGLIGAYWVVAEGISKISSQGK